MKKITFLSCTILGHLALAQVAIDKNTFRSKSSILEFNDMKEESGSPRGIILPMLSDSSLAQQGALWFDLKSQKILYRSDSGDTELTPLPPSQPQKSSTVEEHRLIAGTVLTLQSELPYSSDPAVLKLDSKKSALLLPFVHDATSDISDPEAGTMVYDGKSKSLALFNGEHWYFWN